MTEFLRTTYLDISNNVYTEALAKAEAIAELRKILLDSDKIDSIFAEMDT